LQFEFASGQIQGKRAAQEDTVDVLLPSQDGERPGELVRFGRSSSLVVVVADGMGGHVGGRVASNLSSKYFLESVDRSSGDWSDRLDRALLQANDVLRSATDQRPELVGMGSTLVGGVINGSGVGWVSVGDSGLYLFRQGMLHRLNEDHSFGAYLDQQVRDGLIAAEVAASDRRRNQLFHALLGDPLDHYERFSGFRDLAPGDVVLLASDGLKTLPDSRIGEIIAAHAESSPDDILRGLLDAVEAENREKQDNASLIVVRVREGEMPRSDHVAGHGTTVTLVRIEEVDTAPQPVDPLGDEASSLVHATPAPAAAVAKPAAPPPVPQIPDTPAESPSRWRNIALIVFVALIVGGALGLAWVTYAPLMPRLH
jgi:PPM family protein phosphatase